MSERERQSTRVYRRFWQSHTLFDPERPCRGCGYCLLGLPSTTRACPECGRELLAGELEGLRERSSVWLAAKDACTMPMWCVALLVIGIAGSMVGMYPMALCAFFGVFGLLVLAPMMAVDFLWRVYSAYRLPRGLQRREWLRETAIVAAAVGGVYAVAILLTAVSTLLISVLVR